MCRHSCLFVCLFVSVVLTFSFSPLFLSSIISLTENITVYNIHLSSRTDHFSKKASRKDFSRTKLIIGDFGDFNKLISAIHSRGCLRS